MPEPRPHASPRAALQPDSHRSSARLAAQRATLGYDRRVISTDLSVEVPDKSFTVIIGPNACGKSTLLRALSRLLSPHAGEIVLDGKALSDYRSKDAARAIGLLPQTSEAPDGITVVDLVARGRFPHQKLIRQWTQRDEDAVWSAMAATDTDGLAGRLVAELSGGQRQRVWAAMALAQDTPILLLDEPTTYLDIAHQIDLLDLFARLHRAGSTLVAVLHDINHAARYASHLVVMKEGRVVATGAPRDIVTAELIEEVFGLPCVVIDDPVSHTPLVIPRAGEWHRGGEPAQ